MAIINESLWNAALQIAVPMIKRYEGFRAHAYSNKLADGVYDVWTIGYGTTVYATGSLVKKGDIITLEAAEQQLLMYCNKTLSALRGYFTKLPTAHQLAAFIDLGYNAGSGFVSKSNALKVHNAGSSSIQVAEYIRKSATTSKGITLHGLVVRRAEEAALYLTGVTGKTLSLILLIGISFILLRR